MSIPKEEQGFGDEQELVIANLVQSEPLFDFTILGQPYSKANGRAIVKFGKRWGSIKSKEARAYADSFARQVPRIFPCLTGVLYARIHIAYASNQPDVDESIILDAMQVRLINNDRQIRHRTVTHEIDEENPRARIRLWQWPS